VELHWFELSGDELREAMHIVDTIDEHLRLAEANGRVRRRDMAWSALGAFRDAARSLFATTLSAGKNRSLVLVYADELLNLRRLVRQMMDSDLMIERRMVEQVGCTQDAALQNRLRRAQDAYARGAARELPARLRGRAAQRARNKP
jgi:hypothetical protein